MLIRDARLDDADQVARLHVAAWRSAYRGLAGDDVPERLSVEARAEQVRRLVAGDGVTRVAEVDGRIAGWSAVEAGELSILYVDPAAWGTGVATALLREAEAAGATYLWTLEGNARARRFYERQGWECEGMVRDHDFSGVLVDGGPLVLREIRYAIGPLAAERARTVARLAALRRDFDGIVAASESSNADDEHDPEGATIAFERAQVVALIEQAEAQLDRVELALRRRRDGGYGVCERCGGPIGAERLAARPTATTCIGCAT